MFFNECSCYNNNLDILKFRVKEEVKGCVEPGHESGSTAGKATMLTVKTTDACLTVSVPVVPVIPAANLAPIDDVIWYVTFLTSHCVK